MSRFSIDGNNCNDQYDNEQKHSHRPGDCKGREGSGRAPPPSTPPHGGCAHPLTAETGPLPHLADPLRLPLNTAGHSLCLVSYAVNQTWGRREGRDQGAGPQACQSQATATDKAHQSGCLPPAQWQCPSASAAAEPVREPPTPRPALYGHAPSRGQRNACMVINESPYISNHTHTHNMDT